MKDLSKLQKKAYKTNNPDFLHTVENRDFDDMADCYNEMMQYEGFGAIDEVDKYCFTEILDGYVIHLPLLARAKIKAMGPHFYYGLAEEYINYIVNQFPEDDDKVDLVYDLFKEDFLECKKVELTESDIKFTQKAVKQLRLSVGDIVKLWFDEDVMVIEKYE